MGEKMKIAVAPAIQVGGSLFTPEQLSRIGFLAGPDAQIEMTSFKQLYVEVETGRLDEVKEELRKVGLEVYPAGFATKSLIACHFCRGAEDAGLEAAKKLNRAIAGIETPTPLKVGYAGCGLGTSEPLLKDIGVVKTRDTFNIYIGGEPKGLKASVATLFLEGVSEEQLAPVVSKLIAYYKENAKGKEKFKKFMERVTIEQLKAIVA
ncbi:NAD(P)/FAD-dependent oxidoreductase [Paenibacillus alkalitolerans]|uniref:nitrite reductase n=1 Tax=Paenibacillus alkalitolerans TaxID=2799335 RepID=UPI0018F34F08|nr:nitrite reductase [Paenibacillus alkalitolerans]